MNRIVATALIALSLSGCALLDKNRNQNPYLEPQFYEKYLSNQNMLDQHILRALEALRSNPSSASRHNELGQLLVQKGFPKDAEREFERALAVDPDFYAAHYNLGLVRMARGDVSGARRALTETVDLKPGHAQALFQLGLMEEQRGNRDDAVELYAKAFAINKSLLDVRVNPRILDTKLTHLAMIRLYPNAHARQTMQFQGTPPGYTDPTPREAPSPQAPAPTIVTPAPPVTDPGTQTPAPGPSGTR